MNSLRRSGIGWGGWTIFDPLNLFEPPRIARLGPVLSRSRKRRVNSAFCLLYCVLASLLSSNLFHSCSCFLQFRFVFFFAVRDSSFCRSSAVCLKGSSFIASLDCPSIAGHKLDFASLSKQVSRVFISLPYVEAKNLSSQKPKQKLDCLIVSSLVSQFSEPEKEAIVHRSTIARSKLHGLVCDLQILLYWIFKVSYWHWFMNSEVLLFSLSLSFRTSLFPVRKIIVNYFFSSG